MLEGIGARIAKHFIIFFFLAIFFFFFLESTFYSQTFPALGTTSLLASQPTNLQTFASLLQSAPNPTPNSPPPANTLTQPGFSVPAREVQWKLERERLVM